MDNKKPSTTFQSGRRKSGGCTQLRSPIIKRPPAAPVSLQGWLHKQGSEGLMLWKKRWFVLSEYCLFYYKGPEEEKLLGSILLPSYKVSPCTTDDKVYRKFAFKAEHANMRTYYFAAETKELMAQWMNALSLATILQEGGKPQLTATSSIRPGFEDSNGGGFPGYCSPSVAVTVQPTRQAIILEENCGNINGWAPQHPQNPYQPLYANAPPKPKRLNNEGYYGGSSPETSPSRREEGENNIYGNRRQFQPNVNSNRAQDYYSHSYKSGYKLLPNPDIVSSMEHYSENQIKESKASNTLSKINTTLCDYSEKTQKKDIGESNYSDIFKGENSNVTVFQKGEPNFSVYGKCNNNNNNNNNNPAVNYQHFNQYYQSYQKTPQMSSSPNSQAVANISSSSNKSVVKSRQPPRPHSADFLDYDAKKYYPYKESKDVAITRKLGSNTDSSSNFMRPPRPKSSLDVMYTNDGYYWSEERYAEKMRQSAMYLQNTLPQRSQSSRSNTPNVKHSGELNKITLESKSSKSEQTSVILPKKREVLFDAADSLPRRNLPNWSDNQHRIENHFFRSASARLPKQRGQDDESDEVQAYTGGIDFREEKKEDSMKRLFEWKQRMLQSPLTRKSSGSSTRGVGHNDLSKFYKQQVLKELERQEAKSRELDFKRFKSDGTLIQNWNIDGRRSAMQPSDRYYSYSSDDEESKEIREDKTRNPSLSGMSRSGNEGTKGKVLQYASPDYENVTQAHELSDSHTLFNSDLGYEISGKEKLIESKGNFLLKNSRIFKMENELTPDECLDGKSSPSKCSEGDYETLKRTTEIPEPPASDTSSFTDQTTHPPKQYICNSTLKKRNRSEKIDETKLIKEFSYQYIKEGQSSEKNITNNYKMLDAPPENIVKSRIKQLGLKDEEHEGKEIAMKEPLKMSLPIFCLNEAHVSNLKSADINIKKNRKDISKFAFGDVERSSESTTKDVLEKNKKSVKDLLADFERKSQLFQEREALEHEKSFEEIPGKRYVFSDTETLLYDTSSDTEDKKEGLDPFILNNLKKSEPRREAVNDLSEEEGDEEVAAALGRRERFFSSCRDLGRKRDSDGAFRGKRLLKTSDSITEPSPSSEVETLNTPLYLRSSLSESVAALENSDSSCSTPTIDRIKENLEKTLPKENLTKLELSKNMDNSEGHYMPMTPSRKVSAPSSDKSRSNSSLHSFLYAVDPEETYVEMAENGASTTQLEPNKSSLTKIRKAFLDHNGPGYCEVPMSNFESHYDFLYRSSSLREPEYMEVNTLLEILKEQDEKIKEHKDAVEQKLEKISEVQTSEEIIPPTPPRSTLPDILNSSSTNQQIQKSDSSDADDESSKDLDSLDVPRHPRFSLSDTFRPASYYLGNALTERNRNIIRLPNPNENHDSSDSDLVSPPPIPTSPPLLEDIDTSLETEKSLDFKPLVMSKVKLGDKDTGKKLWSKSFQIAQNLEKGEETRKKKRRPLSEDILETFEEESDQSFYEKPLVFGELDSIRSRNGLVLDEGCDTINFDQYLEELQLNNSIGTNMYSRNFTENIYKSCEKEITKNLMPKDSLSKSDSSEKRLIKLQYSDKNPKIREGEFSEKAKPEDEVQYENLQALFPPPPPELYESSNDQSDRESSKMFYKSIAFPEVPPPENYCDSYEPVGSSKICFDPDTLQQQKKSLESSNVKSSGAFENQGAPYYYSDIIKNDQEEFCGPVLERNVAGIRGVLGNHRYQPLNNQREDLQEPSQCVKRNDIGRKVNPISQNYQGQAENISKTMDDVEKITAELRTTSAHFIDAADKSGTVDVRNIYESDTLQRRKAEPVEGARSRTPELSNSQAIARNLYPHGIKDKTLKISSTSIDIIDREFTSVQSRIRSRSLEGLLNEVTRSSEMSERTDPMPNNENDIRFEKSSSNSVRLNYCEGDEFWEKDTLWRENLRKVSLRHTRSLDNLDDDITSNVCSRLHTAERNLVPNKFESGRRSVDHFSTLETSTSSVERRNADNFLGPLKAKLSREVTYVNEAVKRNRAEDLNRECEQNYREGRIRSIKSEIQPVVEPNDTSSLDFDDGVHYEKLIRDRRNEQERGMNYQEKYQWDGSLRNSIMEKEIFIKPKKLPTSSGLHPSHTSQSNRGSLALEPIDREKLRQWDLMSSGAVGHEVERKKSGDIQCQNKEKKLELVKPEGMAPLADVRVHLENQEPKTQTSHQDLTPTAEASVSNSVIRETYHTQPETISPKPKLLVRQVQKPSFQSPLPHTIEKQENVGNMDQTEKSLADFNERIDYFDRGKPHPSSINGFDEWNDSFSEGRGDFNVGNDPGNFSERRKSIPENDYFFDQCHDRKGNSEYSRNCGTLPLAKGSSLASVPSINLQSSSLGRSTGNLDGSYLAKDIAMKKKVPSSPWGLDVSAGELLGRTHEELVLLLIQLRRQSASVCKAMEACHIEIEEQARMAEIATPNRVEHIRKLEKLKNHLLELEKQYEKGKPLVNLVDNMVKLGSLYRGNNQVYNSNLGLDHSPNVREKLEFNQKVQEQRLLAEERRDWDRLSPDHGQLQAKVQKLYRLDRLLQEESGTLHSLQHDKELLEKALGGLRHKLQVSRSNPVEADRYRKQQKLLEKELSRVRLLLAHNSKKLEETVAENARLEQELVILRQKLQASRVSSRNSVPLLPESTTLSTTAALEAELRRVQQLVGDLQRQRHELSAQVKQLTEKSDTLVQQIRPGPTGVAGAGPIPGKKKSSTTWLETDLDLLVTQDVGVESPIISPQHQQQSSVVPIGSRSTTPIYINTETSKKEEVIAIEQPKSPSKAVADNCSEETQIKTYCMPLELSEADERMKRFYGIIPREKQEIKTVRIVKRESERRQRDRDRSGNIGIPVGNSAIAKRVSVIEENDSYGLSRVDEETYEAFPNSSNFGETGEEYNKQKLLPCRGQNGNTNPYLKFHPTNPFLPQNLHSNNEDLLGIDQDFSMTSQKALSLPMVFGKNDSLQYEQMENSSSLKSITSKKNRVRFENLSGNRIEPTCLKNENISKNHNSIPNQEECSSKNINIRLHSLMQKSSNSNENTNSFKGLKMDFEQNITKEGSLETCRRPTARELLFGSNHSMNEENSPQLSPVYQSEAAREIILEMSSNPVGSHSNRRQIRKEKRRHYTLSNIRHPPENDSHLSRMGSARSRDDLDMERALRPRINAPDVVRSTMNHKDLKYNESTIDSILGTPNKIVIPERYIPEQEPILSAEEQLQRLRKAESIKKMLSETTAISTPDLSGEDLEEERKSCSLRKKVEEEKKQREHLLELNQILAQQVMEKSKLVAGSVTSSSHHQD